MQTKKLQILNTLIKQAENADMLDGKHADEFATVEDINALQSKIGDTSVSEQISSAVGSINHPVQSVNGKTGAVQLTASDVGALSADTTIPSISGLATEEYVDGAVANKVDKVAGKGLSTNDFTNEAKTKLAGIEAGANKIVVDNALSSTSTNPVQNKAVNTAISNLNTLVGDKSVSEQITTAIASKSDVGHTHTADEVGSDASGSAASALTSAKSYTDTKIADLINSAPTTLDTLGEIATAMSENADVVAALEESIGTKANTSDLTDHTANKSNPHGVTLSQLGVTATATELNYVDGVTSKVQTQLNAKVPTSRTVNGKALSANITLSASDVGADASGAADTALTNAKAYTDAEIEEWVGDTPVAEQITTAIANKSDTNHTHDDRYYTESEIDSKLSGKSDTGHTHSSYVNQNAFSNVVVGSTTISADSTTDSLTLVAGSNITLTPDATNDKVTIAAKDTVYTHPTSGVTAGTYKSVTVNAQGHVTGGSNPTTLSGYGITDGATKTQLNAVSALVGDTAVSEQISDAFDDAITGLSVSGEVVTYTKGDGSTGTISTQDTNVKQTVTTTDAEYPLMLAPSGQTATQTTTAYFDSGVTLNPSTNMIAANISGNAATATNITVSTLASGTDLNNVTTAGYYGQATAATAKAFANNPLSTQATGIFVKVYKTGGVVYQELSGIVTGGIYKRRYASSEWSSWIQMARTTDNVASATKLKTGHTLKVNLASTNASTAFNGEKDITDIGVSGTLPIANGGTGATTAAGVLTGLGITATADELNYVDGVTSNVQTQINNLSTLVGDTAVAEQISGAFDDAITGLSVSGKTITYTKGDGTTDTITTQDTDTKVTQTLTEDAALNTSWCLLASSGSATGTRGAVFTKDARLQSYSGTTDADGEVEMILGNNIASGKAGNKEGFITLYSNGNSWHRIIGETRNSSGVTHTLPATTGTILNSGTTSFTQSLTSGTKIGTLKINGSDIDLYCEKNTDTTYNAATTSAAGLMSAADKTSLNNLVTLVGDTSVSAQISAAVGNHTQASSTISTGGSEGQLLVVNADGTISPNSRTVSSLGTGATYSLNGTTLTITTL